MGKQIALTSVIVGVLSIGTWSRSARAQDYVDFKDAYVTATEHFDHERYGAAREAFLKAYTIRPEPLVLYNVAECFSNEGNYREALVYYRRYLRTPAPDPVPRERIESRQEAERQVQKLEQMLGETPETSTSERRAKPKAAKVAPSPVTAIDAKAPSSHDEAAAPTRDAALTARRPPAKRSTMRKWALVTLGVGGAALLGAGTFGILGLQAESDHKDHPTTDSADQVERYQTLTNSSLVIAGLAVAGGATLYLLSKRSKTEQPNAQASLLVGATPESVAALVHIPF